MNRKVLSTFEIYRSALIRHALREIFFFETPIFLSTKKRIAKLSFKADTFQTEGHTGRNKCTIIQRSDIKLIARAESRYQIGIQNALIKARK